MIATGNSFPWPQIKHNEKTCYLKKKLESSKGQQTHKFEHSCLRIWVKLEATLPGPLPAE